MDDIRNPILESIAAAREAGAESVIPEGLISADSHVTEPPGCYLDRIDPAFRDRAPRVMTDTDGGDVFVIDGMPGSVPVGIIAAAGIDPRDIKKGETKFADLHKGGWDGKARIADQERDGIAAEIIYPSVGMVICNHPDADYKQACMWPITTGWRRNSSPARRTGCSAWDRRRCARSPRRLRISAGSRKWASSA